ncbi:DUF2273 domain-containing protein [Polycladomyces sp. WAk]|uniref:DUF2273 domain-containing protein n=1 Tax=Polycladomyces zharkentensis TaxID=2807616 RepID=A0ABS2WJU8_9BACL|nr:DUF2273 domain-containing protein [Polycladomyces sp. WAk]MBN2909832.1 DUF2273 domain-containing protein [Polycladomyces sp. WAk]
MDWKWLEYLWVHHRGRLIGTLAGLILGIVYLVVGLWKTFVFALIVGIGYFVGREWDGRKDLRQVLEDWFPDRWMRK